MNRYLITLTAANPDKKIWTSVQRTIDAEDEQALRKKVKEDHPLHSLTINGVVKL